MGRFGQIVGPLIAGALLGAGWTADRIMIIIACGGLIGAVFVMLFRAWFVRRDAEIVAEEKAAATPAAI